MKRTPREKILNPEPSFLRRRFSPPRFVIPYFLFDETLLDTCGIINGN